MWVYILAARFAPGLSDTNGSSLFSSVARPSRRRSMRRAGASRWRSMRHAEGPASPSSLSSPERCSCGSLTAPLPALTSTSRSAGLAASCAHATRENSRTKSWLSMSGALSPTSLWSPSVLPVLSLAQRCSFPLPSAGASFSSACWSPWRAATASLTTRAGVCWRGAPAACFPQAHERPGGICSSPSGAARGLACPSRRLCRTAAKRMPARQPRRGRRGSPAYTSPCGRAKRAYPELSCPATAQTAISGKDQKLEGRGTKRFCRHGLRDR